MATRITPKIEGGLSRYYKRLSRFYKRHPAISVVVLIDIITIGLILYLDYLGGPELANYGGKQLYKVLAAILAIYAILFTILAILMIGFYVAYYVD